MSPTKIWRIIDLINWTINHFNNKNITNARKEIEWFLCNILHCKRIDLYLKFDNNLNAEQLKKFKYMIRRRLNGEPFQHIIGKASFYGRDFIVNNKVLVPRPETELIIDILKKENKVSNLLEIGTGSGCIAITCSLENLSNNIHATDISKEALSIAKKNITKYNINHVELIQHDFLNDNFNMQYNIIVSNPPYINIKQLSILQNEVKNYDPHIALTDGGDGLTFYRRFAKTFLSIIKLNGFMLLEIGGDEYVDDITKIFNESNLQIKFYKDMQGNKRVIKITR